MGLLELILYLAVLGLVVYLITAYIPMPEPFAIVIKVLVVVCAVLFVLRVLGLDIMVPRLR